MACPDDGTVERYDALTYEEVVEREGCFGWENS